MVSLLVMVNLLVVVSLQVIVSRLVSLLVMILVVRRKKRSECRVHGMRTKTVSGPRMHQMHQAARLSESSPGS